MKFLTPPEWKITGITETATSLLVRAESLIDPLNCRHCKASPELLRNYGITTLLATDTPLRDKSVKISLTRRRYLCSVCHGTSLQPITGIAKGHRVTDRLIKLVVQRAFRTPPEVVATELGLPERLVRAAVSEEVERLEHTVSCDTPRMLNVRLANLCQQERLLLADVETRHVVSITTGTDREAAIRALSKLRKPGEVEIVTMPMSRHLWRAVRQALPWAKIIVDRFLVMSLGNDALDAVRKHVCSCSPRLKDEKALLAAAYVLRARFIDIFRTDSTIVARRRYSEWVGGLPEELGFAFRPLVRIVEAWSEEIFGYFDHHFLTDKPQIASQPSKLVQRRVNLRKNGMNRARGIVAE